MILSNNLTMEKRGKFIVIDGLDGSGKATQAKLLVKRLINEGYDVEMADFPQYGEWSCQFVEKYLRGEFGGALDVGAKRASLFYAIDRYAASFQIKEWLDQNKIVISNRYVSANKGHQLGKINDVEEMKHFLKWINEIEYDIFDIPVPHLTLFLHMTPKVGQQLVDKKGERLYTHGKKRDIHEDDLEHLRNAERAYLFCLENDLAENWQRIICSEREWPKAIGTIHNEVYDKVKKALDQY